MKKTTLLFFMPLCLLFAEVDSAVIAQSAEEAVVPFSRNGLVDARDKAIKARDEASQSLRDKASNIYVTREDDTEAKIAVVVSTESNDTNQSTTTLEVQSKESNSSTPKI